MTSYDTAKNTIARRGSAFLDDIAGTVAAGKGVATEMLGDVCHDTGDWACIFAALGEWDSANEDLNAAIDSIIAAAKTYCSERA